MFVLIALLFIVIAILGRYKIKVGFGDATNVSKRVSLWLTFCVVFFISAFRYNVGYDYRGYYSYFFNMKGARYFEIIPKVFYWIAQSVGTPVVLFALFSFFTLFFFFLGIHKTSVNKYESVIVFMSLFFLNSMSVIRQSLAVAIVFWAYQYVIERDFKKFLFFVIIATFAHKTALIALPIYFIYNFVSWKMTIVVSLFFVLLGEKIVWLFLNMPFFSRFAVYMTTIESNGGNMVRLFYLLLWCVCMFAILYARNKERVLGLFKVISFALFFPVILGPQQGVRMAEYYNVAYILFVPLLLDELRFKIKRHIYMCPFYVYYILYLLIDFFNTRGYATYTFYFFR